MWRLFARRSTETRGVEAPSDHLPDAPVAVAAPPVSEDARSIAHIECVGQAIVATMTAATISSATHTAFNSLLDSLLASDRSWHILDLQNVACIDPCAIRKLREFAVLIAQRGQYLALASTSIDLANQLGLGTLEHPVPVCRDVMSAMETLRRQQAAHNGEVSELVL